MTERYSRLVQMAVLKETEGRGPFASLIMAVVIVKDVVVFVCFAVNIEMADLVSLSVTPFVNHRGLPHWSPQSCRLTTVPNQEELHNEMRGSQALAWRPFDVSRLAWVAQVIKKAESGFSLTNLAEPMYSVFVSIMLGVLYGISIGRIMATPSRYFNVILRHLPQGLGNRCTRLSSADVTQPDDALLGVNVSASLTFPVTSADVLMTL